MLPHSGLASQRFSSPLLAAMLDEETLGAVDKLAVTIGVILLGFFITWLALRDRE